MLLCFVSNKSFRNKSMKANYHLAKPEDLS